MTKVTEYNTDRFVMRGNIVLSDNVAKGYVVINNGLIESLSLTDVLPSFIEASRAHCDEYSCNNLSQHTDKGQSPGSTIFDYGESYIMPGLIEQHIHGAKGCEFIDGLAESNANIGRYLTSQGITTVVPTLITSPQEKLSLAIQGINASIDDEAFYPEIAGIFFEGPFISKLKKGAHKAEHIHVPDVSLAQSMVSLPDKRLKSIVLIAPELEGATELTRELVSSGSIVTGGHSNATFDETIACIDAGMTGITHLWNAMSPYHHRAPGIAGAALESDAVFCEIICDFLHVHRSVVKSSILCSGTDRIVLISDMTGPGGLSEGQYDWDGRTVSVSSKFGIRLKPVNKESNSESLPTTQPSDWVLAGANLNTKQTFNNILDMGFSVSDFVKMKCSTPAEFLQLSETCGQLKQGRKADITVITPDGTVTATIINGQFVFKKEAKPI